MKYNVLYNPYSANGLGKELALEIKNVINADLEFYSMPEIKDFKKFFKHLKGDIIICGGDGTLNYFINHTANINYKNNILYYSTGTGNDFYNEVGNNIKIPFRINEYIKDLPIASIKGKKYHFINGIGFGIDGFCCEEKDKILKKNNKKASYTIIALKGLLYKYQRVNATITVDGNSYSFKDVWLAPTMNGKIYGRGMMIAPTQDRLNKEHKVTTVVIHCKSRLKLLLCFPKVFKGTHIKIKKNVEIFEGKEIKVKLDKPTPLQIDGESFVNVTEYTVYSKK